MRITPGWVALPLLLAACGPSPAFQEPEPPPVQIAAPRNEPVRQAPSPPLTRRPGAGFESYRAGRLAPASIYEGRYLCAQGDTGMTLRIQEVKGRSVYGVFEFFHEPTGARGSFSVEGELSQSGEITFEPLEWIVRPPRYVAVPFRVTVSDDGATLRGGVLHASCGAMEATRTRGGDGG